MERFDAKDLARAVDAGVLQPGQDQALLDFLRQQPQSRGSFQLAHVAFYFGALLIMAAMGWLLTEAWMRIGDSALLAIALPHIAALTLFALSLQRRGQPIAAGVLAAVAVSIVPLAVFAVERLAGWWPLDDAQGDYHQYYTYVQGGWLAMEAATVVAGLLMLRLVPFPFIVMPIAVALWFMSMDLTNGCMAMCSAGSSDVRYRCGSAWPCWWCSSASMAVPARTTLAGAIWPACWRSGAG
jgi:hypothetical protein